MSIALETPNAAARPHRLAWLRDMVGRRSGAIGLAIVLAHVVLALVSPWIAPYDPVAQDVTSMLVAPGAEHWLGTDKLGRDVFTRTLLGGREALLITALASIIAMIWGGLLGMMLGLVGGRIDEWVMRVVDALLSIPWILTLLLFVTILGTGTVVLIFILGFSYGLTVIRIARAAALDIVTKDFVLAAQARGHDRWTIVNRELMPNVRDSLAVEAAMNWSWMLLGFSSLSFLGFGVAPPTPDWGLMISDSRGIMATAPWTVVAPMVALASLIIGINLAADALAKALGIDRSQKAPL